MHLYQASLAFRILGSLSLSTVYFAFAFGLWAMEQESLITTADTLMARSPALATTSGSLTVNILFAVLLSMLTTYFFMRRHTTDSNDLSVANR